MPRASGAHACRWPEAGLLYPYVPGLPVRIEPVGMNRALAGMERDRRVEIVGSFFHAFSKINDEKELW